MRQSAHSRTGAFAAAAVLAAVIAPAALAQTMITREGDRWVRTFTGALPGCTRLRVNGHGPVTLDAGVANELTYTIKVSVKAPNEERARQFLIRSAVHLVEQGETVTLTLPGGLAVSTASVKAPKLDHVEISTSEGAVHATGVDGDLLVDSGAGELYCDRIHGNTRLLTGGGDIRCGQIGGALQGTTGAGRINVRTAGGEAVLQTNGGDIDAGDIGGPCNARTGGGSIHINTAGGPVSAITGGGQIVVGKANGIVTARNMAGPVQVNSAAGVRCESGTGGIRLNNVSGSMRVSTAMGSIFASLMAGRLTDSFLATGNGDITVLIPSNLGVTIRAENDFADTVRRIVSDFSTLQPRRQGTVVVAEGAVNGGGPLLRISGTGGTIFIRRQ